MLALLLAMGGAWAQEEVLLTTITPTSIDSYDETTPGVVNVILDGQLEYDNTDGWQAEYGDGNQGSVTVTANPGFSIDSCKFYVDEDSYTVTAAPFAVYPYCLGSTQIVTPQPNAQGSFWSGGVTRIEVYGTAQAIKLTPDATGKVWTLAETPDYNLDLQVVYYQKYALKEIPAGWQVKVDGVDKTAAIDGDSLKITETAQVILTPDHPERVKKVTLVDEAVAPQLQTVHVGNMADATFYYLPGETWRQAIENHPTENAGFSISGNWVTYNGMQVNNAGNPINNNTEVDPNAEYEAII